MTPRERAVILVKAWPQPSKRYGETVCCAGVTPQGEWRRLFPIRYRHLTGDSKFSRWDIVEYGWHRPKDDPRKESRRVDEPSLRILGKMKEREREGFFDRLLRRSTAEAYDRGESLTLIRPRSLTFRAKRKSEREMEADFGRRDRALAQKDMFDPDLKRLPICPYALRIQYEDSDGGHGGMCGDWETTWTFMKWRKEYGEDDAIRRLKERYEQEYMDNGVALALGTVHKRPRQWLLLGVVRLDEAKQQLLF